MMRGPTPPTVLTVGHSNGQANAFLDLLRAASVQVLVDVRSQPTSAFAPQFDRVRLTEDLETSGIRYVFLGTELGGRPQGPGMYDKDGHVLYGRVADSDRFKDGVRRLTTGIEQYRIAVMCSEEDPTNCHRRLLVGRVLRMQGVDVQHLRADGSMQTEAEVAAAERLRYPDRYQEKLFGGEETEWRSIRSVSGGTRRPTSSAS
jgi:uncharacterized protein (DUF488 family)